MNDKTPQTPEKKTGADGNAGAGGDQGAPAKKPDAAAGGDTTGGDNPAPSIYRPDGLPDHLVGATDHETIDRLTKTVEGFRDQQAGKGIPAKPDDYKLELPDDITVKMIRPAEDGKDAMLTGFQSLFHKHGIPQAAFQDIAGELYKQVSEMSAAQAGDAPQLDFEYKGIGGETGARPLVDGVNAWITGLKNQGKIGEKDAQELGLMALHTDGLNAISKLRELAGEKAIPVNLTPQQGEGQLTEADLNALVADPRYRKGSKEFDPGFHADVTKKFQEFYKENKAA